MRSAQNCLIIRAILIVKKIQAWKPEAYGNETVGQKYSHFQTITTNNRKHVPDFISNNTETFREFFQIKL